MSKRVMNDPDVLEPAANFCRGSASSINFLNGIDCAPPADMTWELVYRISGSLSVR